MHTELIKELIEEAKLEVVVETQETNSGGLVRKASEKATLEVAWRSRRANKLFLQLFDQGKKKPTATYRLSFAYPMKRITAWQYEELEKMNKETEQLELKLRPRKVKLLEIFMLFNKLKKFLTSGALARDQLLFTMNNKVLIENPIDVIDCVMVLYQHRKIEQAVDYADKAASRRMAHKFDPMRLTSDQEQVELLARGKEVEAEMQAEKDVKKNERELFNELDADLPSFDEAATHALKKTGGASISENADEWIDEFMKKGKEEIAERLQKDQRKS